jgi:hypothetical protein
MPIDMPDYLQVRGYPIPTVTQPYGGEHPHKTSTNIALGIEGPTRRPTHTGDQAKERNS